MTSVFYLSLHFGVNSGQETFDIFSADILIFMTIRQRELHCVEIQIFQNSVPNIFKVKQLWNTTNVHSILTKVES